MQKLVKISFYFSLSLCVAALLLIISTYFYVKPSLPEINLVDEDVLQIPLKVYSADGVLIGEFGDQKRRTIEFKGQRGGGIAALLRFGFFITDYPWIIFTNSIYGGTIQKNLLCLLGTQINRAIFPQFSSR